jgi:hypothetical protein
MTIDTLSAQADWREIHWDEDQICSFCLISGRERKTQEVKIYQNWGWKTTGMYLILYHQLITRSFSKI